MDGPPLHFACRRRAGAVLLAGLLALAVAAPAQAKPNGPAHEQNAPMVLPGDGSPRAAAARTPGWIVAGDPGPRTAAIARRYGAEASLPEAGIYAIATSRARVFAAELERAGLLRFAEPDERGRMHAFPKDPLSFPTPGFPLGQWWLDRVVGDPNLTPPPVTARSPEVAVVDSIVDTSLPDFAGTSRRIVKPGVTDDAHGTQVGGAIGAQANGVGVVGVWPGARLVSSYININLNCSDVTRAVGAASRGGAKVINMSYGFAMPACFSHLVATQLAYGRGAILVASGGNEFEQGNQASRPAVDPHIITVAAVTPQLESAAFSNENNAIDLSAPGTDLLLPTPLRFDEDGVRDGFSSVDGTSFSAPIVAGAAAWIKQARPRLTSGQITGVLQDGAQDLGERGWEQRFGYGLLNIARSLRVRPRPIDPREPNDDIEWVDGRRFGRPDPLIFNGSARSLNATLDQLEDPADVYRIRVPARARVRVRLQPRFGNPDLELYTAAGRTINSRRGRVTTSVRGGSAVDAIIYKNPLRRARTMYVDVYVDPDNDELTAGYRLSVTRLR